MARPPGLRLGSARPSNPRRHQRRASRLNHQRTYGLTEIREVGRTDADAVRTHKTALATLVDRDGRPLPPGLELVSADGRLTAQVADAGLAYIRGEGEGELVLETRPGQPAFACNLPVLPDEPLSPLGRLTCE
jgi:hypothetical protein